jgi:hypothetical protein
MNRTTVVAVILGVLLIALAAGCGSKKSASASQTTTTSESTTTTSSGSGSGSSSGKPSFASTKNCAQLASLASKIANSVNSTGGKIDLKGYSDAMDALANAAPDEIKSDFKTFADALKDFASTMSDAGLKAGETPTAAQIAKLTTASEKLSTPKIRAATEHLEAWGQKNCGFSSTSP